MARAMWKAPAAEAGLSSSASANACSGGKVYCPVFGSYVT
jgi:hypothetical protein